MTWRNALSRICFISAVVVWSYDLHAANANPLPDLILLVLGGWLFLETRLQNPFLLFLMVAAPVRIYSHSYAGSFWGIFDPVQIKDYPKLLDSLTHTLLGNKTLALHHSILFLLFGVSMTATDRRKLRLPDRNTMFRISVPALLIVPALIWSFQKNTREESIAYRGLEKNRYYFGSEELESPPKGDLGMFRGKSLVLFVVESVGKSGFDEPGIRQLIESTKQKFKLHSLTFSSIEGGFPATTRSHLALQTGGLALTLGALNDELLEMKAPFHLSRAFAEKKYKTGVFTPVKWDFENLDRFYRHLQWDRIFDYRRFSEKDLKKIGGNSWGYDEKPFFDEMERWLLAGSARKFAVYINNNTHHPYQAASVSLLDDARTRYRKSAAELITRIQGLVESLSNRGVLDRFVIGITGDHGEAFGEVHKGNFLHRNALYEENLGNELILLSSSMKSDAERSNLISQGDVFPTLTDLFSLKTPPLGHSYYLGVRKLIFFHKLATPEEWGLRDGEWKFIERRFGPEEGALFNLHDDPREQINRLPEFRDRGRLYSSLIKEWFWEKRNEFYRSTGLPLTQASLGEEDFLSASRSGIQRVYLVPGHHQRERSYLEFIRPTDRPCFLLLVNIGGEKRNAHLSLVSPSGKKFGFDQPVLPEWRRIWVTPSLPLPLEVGTWRVFSGDQGRMLKTEFKVKS